MHKFSLAAFGVLISFIILGVSFFNQTKPPIVTVYAEDEPEVMLEETASPSGDIMDTPQELTSDYYLPYPGILPDHPFYWAKMIRDRLKLWSTSDPLSKANLMLLYADKRIGAAQALASGNKLPLAQSTANKAEIYLSRVAATLSSLDISDQAVKQAWETLYLSSNKHKQILENILQSAPDPLKAGLNQSLVLAEQVVATSQNSLEASSL